MILTTITAAFLDIEGLPLLWIAGVFGWTAGVILFPDTPVVLKAQVILIALAGIVLLAVASFYGEPVKLDRIITANTGLLSMIAAVGFLKLVVIPPNQELSQLPQGPKAFLQTLIGLNISSSIINVSAPILIADRIHQQRPLDRFTAQSMVRVFCGVSNWSPFFGAMAVVLTYVEGASLSWIIIAGLPFTLIGFILVYLEARIRYKTQIENFVGYPMQYNALKIPVTLIMTVSIGTTVFPSLPILLVISTSALLVTSVTLIIREGPMGAITFLKNHVVQGLPRMVNELNLFLVAGILAVGISGLLVTGILENPFNTFNVLTAIELLLVIWLVAIFGIHPVIMISGLSPMILSLDPDPNLLAITYLIGWHLGTCSNPLSGTNLVFQGRYGIPGWKIAFWNWPYALLMFLIATLWLSFVAGWFPKI
jgi:hypothetical protein